MVLAISQMVIAIVSLHTMVMTVPECHAEIYHVLVAAYVSTTVHALANRVTRVKFAAIFRAPTVATDTVFARSLMFAIVTKGGRGLFALIRSVLEYHPVHLMEHVSAPVTANVI